MEQLFSSAAINDDEDNLALPLHSDNEHTLDLGILPDLCIAACRFHCPSHFPAPEWPPEKAEDRWNRRRQRVPPRNRFFLPLFIVVRKEGVLLNLKCNISFFALFYCCCLSPYWQNDFIKHNSPLGFVMSKRKYI
jgi:hypothetical protein